MLKNLDMLHRIAVTFLNGVLTLIFSNWCNDGNEHKTRLKTRLYKNLEFEHKLKIVAEHKLLEHDNKVLQSLMKKL